MTNITSEENEIRELKMLIENKTPESRTLEYKENFDFNNDKSEFTTSVVAFANTAGGRLYYGVRTKRDPYGKTNGIPEEIVGLSNIGNRDEYKLRINNSLADRIEPGIGKLLETKILDCSGNKTVVLIKVPRSFVAPHAICKGKGSYRFYYRSDVNNIPMDFPQIRSMFLESEELEKKIDKFRADRIMKILSGEIHTNLYKGIRVVLHVVPLSIKDDYLRMDVKKLKQIFNLVYPFIQNDNDRNYQLSRYNLDGHLRYFEDNRGEVAYVQIFRDCKLEIVNATSEWWLQEGQFCVEYFQSITEKVLNDVFTCFNEHFKGIPLVVMFSILNVNNLSISYSPKVKHNITDREHLLIPDIYVEEPHSAKEVTKQIFDIIWQSFGFEGIQ
jgi:hypothetical protein